MGAAGSLGLPAVAARARELHCDALSHAALVFCTVHKAKGLEFPAVYVLGDVLGCSAAAVPPPLLLPPPARASSASSCSFSTAVSYLPAQSARGTGGLGGGSVHGVEFGGGGFRGPPAPAESAPPPFWRMATRASHPPSTDHLFTPPFEEVNLIYTAMVGLARAAYHLFSVPTRVRKRQPTR